MRLIRFIVGVLAIGLVLFAFFRPDLVDWVRHHETFDAFAALIAIIFHWVNTYHDSPVMRSWGGSIT